MRIPTLTWSVSHQWREKVPHGLRLVIQSILIDIAPIWVIIREQVQEGETVSCSDLASTGFEELIKRRLQQEKQNDAEVVVCFYCRHFAVRVSRVWFKAGLWEEMKNVCLWRGVRLLFVCVDQTFVSADRCLSTGRGHRDATDWQKQHVSRRVHVWSASKPHAKLTRCKNKFKTTRLSGLNVVTICFLFEATDYDNWYKITCNYYKASFRGWVIFSITDWIFTVTGRPSVVLTH